KISQNQTQFLCLAVNSLPVRQNVGIWNSAQIAESWHQKHGTPVSFKLEKKKDRRKSLRLSSPWVAPATWMEITRTRGQESPYLHGPCDVRQPDGDDLRD